MVGLLSFGHTEYTYILPYYYNKCNHNKEIYFLIMFSRYNESIFSLYQETENIFSLSWRQQYAAECQSLNSPEAEIKFVLKVALEVMET